MAITTTRAGQSTKIMTSIYFMRRESLHQEEKPYAFRYATDEGVPQTNITMVKHSDIPIQDIRGHEQDFALEQNGFAILKLPPEGRIPYASYYDASGVQPYLRSLESLLKLRLNASHVEAFRYGLRKRHPTFPVSTGESYTYDQPTSVAHIDTTTQESLEEVRRQHPDVEVHATLAAKRIQWVNIWKPIRGPLHDWPLCYCSTTSVNPSVDFEPADLLYPDFVTENTQVYYSPQYQWYYLSGQQPDELVVFKQSDTDPSATPGVPHCAFFNPYTPEDELPRESIEVRALVYYD